MNTTRQNNSPTHLFFTVFIAVFLVVVITSTAITFILPESYASTVGMKLESDPPETNSPISSTNGMVPYGGYFIQTTFEIIQSQLVLSNVIAKLDLNDTWGKKYFNGEKLKTTESMEILKQRMVIRPVKNTELMHITVYSDDPNEAAQIANAIAESYREYRNQLFSKSEAAKLDTPAARRSLVEIVEPAVPGKFPVKPNKPLNIAIGVLAGLVLGSVVGGLAAMFSSKTDARR